ncbi:MAG: hemolysin family protein [Saprospiraceae bacterium]
MERTLMYSGIDGRAYLRPEQVPGERLRALRGLGRLRLLMIALALTGAAAALFSPGPIRSVFESLTARYGKGPTYVAPFALTLLVLLAAFALRFAARSMVHHGNRDAWFAALNQLFHWPIRLFTFFYKKEAEAAGATYQEARNTPEPRKQRIIQNILRFGDLSVRQVMQPRSRVEALDLSLRFDEALKRIREAGFSRFPAYSEDLDNVEGILYVKDLLPYLDAGPDFAWQELVRRPAIMTPETKHVGELLQDFKRQKKHMAIVVDEYGGCSGIVTLEDILEEITGEIRDEFDEETDVRYRKVGERSFVFEGQCLLSDVCAVCQLPEDAFDEVRGNAETIAGLALQLLQDIPVQGARTAWKGCEIEIMAADQRRIQQVKLTLPE